MMRRMELSGLVPLSLFPQRRTDRLVDGERASGFRWIMNSGGRLGPYFRSRQPRWSARVNIGRGKEQRIARQADLRRTEIPGCQRARPRRKVQNSGGLPLLSSAIGVTLTSSQTAEITAPMAQPTYYAPGANDPYAQPQPQAYPVADYANSQPQPVAYGQPAMPVVYAQPAQPVAYVQQPMAQTTTTTTTEYVIQQQPAPTQQVVVVQQPVSSGFVFNGGAFALGLVLGLFFGILGFLAVACVQPQNRSSAAIGAGVGVVIDLIIYITLFTVLI